MLPSRRTHMGRADFAGCSGRNVAGSHAEKRLSGCAKLTSAAQKRGPTPALCGSRARNCCFELWAAGTRCSKYQRALDSEAGGGRLRRPAGQSQVKPPRWLLELSYKDHLLPLLDLTRPTSKAK